MLPKINPLTTNAWKLLQQHHSTIRNEHMRDLFKTDQKRFDHYSVKLEEILFDYSKNIVNGTTMHLLMQLAHECQLPAAIEAMFNGEQINETEHRSVLHVALRNFSDEPVYSQGEDVMPLVRKVLGRMKEFCNATPPTIAETATTIASLPLIERAIFHACIVQSRFFALSLID